MPEGDTLFRTARTLHRALAGREVVRFESAYPALLGVKSTGRTVEKVEAAGKHLLMHLSGDLVLRTHLRMNGSWHVYRVGERWRRAPSHMRILVENAEYAAVGFDIPVAELLRARDLPRSEVGRLGPDLLGGTFDEDEALRRLRALGDAEIGPALLAQQAVAGIGNVYKCEVLFVCRTSPFARVSALPDDALRHLLRTARSLLRENVREPPPGEPAYRSGYRRTTGRMSDGERLWVYDRARRPCRRCGTAIVHARQGPEARGTWWCPRCQAAQGAAANPLP